MGYLIFFAIFIGIPIMFIMFKSSQAKSRKESIDAFMAKNDFMPEYMQPYNVAIDSKTKRVVFATPKTKYEIFDVQDIVQIQKNTYKGELISSFQIIFTVNSLATPRIFIPFANEADRDTWYDRFLLLWRI